MRPDRQQAVQTEDNIPGKLVHKRANGYQAHYSEKQCRPIGDLF